VSATPAFWDAERAVEPARTTYRYVARVLPPDAALEAVGRADRTALGAEERQDFAAYEEALREMSRAARRAAARRAA
jgi:hypothetical protein